MRNKLEFKILDFFNRVHIVFHASKNWRENCESVIKRVSGFNGIQELSYGICRRVWRD